MNHATWANQHPPHHEVRYGPIEFVSGHSERRISFWKVAHNGSGAPHGPCHGSACTGHDSHESALAHWRDHLLANELEVIHNPGQVAKCVVCGQKTLHVARIGKLPVIVDHLPACVEHANRKSLESHFAMPDSVTVVYANHVDKPDPQPDPQPEPEPVIVVEPSIAPPVKATKAKSVAKKRDFIPAVAKVVKAVKRVTKPKPKPLVARLSAKSAKATKRR